MQNYKQRQRRSLLASKALSKVFKISIQKTLGKGKGNTTFVKPQGHTCVLQDETLNANKSFVCLQEKFENPTNRLLDLSLSRQNSCSPDKIKPQIQLRSLAYFINWEGKKKKKFNPYPALLIIHILKLKLRKFTAASLAHDVERCEKVGRNARK